MSVVKIDIKKIFKQIVIIFLVVCFAIYIIVFLLRNVIVTLSSFPGMHRSYEVKNERESITDAIEEINFVNSDGNNINGLFLDKNSEKTIYYFHGNGGPLEMFYDEIEYISDFGYNVMAYDYPGYGKSEGFPNDKEVFATSKEFYEFIQKEKKINTGTISLWGYSVGTVMATDFAFHNDFDRLILVAPISSRYDMSIFYFGFNISKFFFMSDTFLNKEKLKKIENATLIVHGNQDRIVPFLGGKINFNNSIADDKYFIEVDGFGHNGILSQKGLVLKPYFKDFLDGKSGVFTENYLFLDSEMTHKIEEGAGKTIQKKQGKKQEDSHTIGGFDPGQKTIKMKKVEQNISVEKTGIVNHSEGSQGDRSLQKFIGQDVSFDVLGYIPSDLVPFTSHFIIDAKGNGLLRAEASKALAQLSEDFYAYFGEKITVVSSYRSYLYQKGIKDRGCPDSLCAKAGYSEHQSGLAIDLWEAIDADSFLGKNHLKLYYEWLQDHAHTYGFHNSYQKGKNIDGYDQEPWHWRYVGPLLATYLHDQKMTFTEFYNIKKRG